MEYSVVLEIDGLNIVLVIELMLKLGVRVMFNWVLVVAIITTTVEVLLACVLAIDSI